MYTGSVLDDILDWEKGLMTEEQETELFQHLVDTGMVWSLQGMYGRRAQQLINEGKIHLRREM